MARCIRKSAIVRSLIGSLFAAAGVLIRSAARVGTKPLPCESVDRCAAVLAVGGGAFALSNKSTGSGSDIE